MDTVAKPDDEVFSYKELCSVLSPNELSSLRQRVRDRNELEQWWDDGRYYVGIFSVGHSDAPTARLGSSGKVIQQWLTEMLCSVNHISPEDIQWERRGTNCVGLKSNAQIDPLHQVFMVVYRFERADP